jgi:acetyl esterase/lipase
VYLHGGRFRWGDKHREARALLYRLASQGWTCISANYHLSATPADGFPKALIDVKRVIAWVRTRGPELSADPHMLVIAGSSAGAHLAAMAALTPNDPQFQPGFEAVDTSVHAGIGLGGYYGALGTGVPSSAPLAHAGPDAPPFMVVHGENGTYTPVEGARSLVEGLRTASTSAVVYAELPGGQHAFDLFHSIRFEQVIDGIDGFVAWIRSTKRVRSDGGGDSGPTPTAPNVTRNAAAHPTERRTDRPGCR